MKKMLNPEVELKKTKDELALRIERRTKELANEKRFVSDVLDNIAEGLVVFDSKGKLIDANPAFVKMTGFSKKELVGQEFPHKFWPEDETELIKSNLKNIITGNFGKTEMVIQRKNRSRLTRDSP